MKQLSSLNVVEKLVIASYELVQGGKSPFSAEDLVVSAWASFPDTFGLRGYRDKNGILKYPDSNRVFAEIMGSKPIRQRGYLAKVGTKKYQLTESGLEFAKFLLSRKFERKIEKAGLPREIEAKLKILLDSRAMKKNTSDQEPGITFFDACNFWNISLRSTSIELKGKLNNFESIMSHVDNIIKDKSVTFKHRGQTFTSKDLVMLRNLNQFLQKKFKKELDIIRERTDERL